MRGRGVSSPSLTLLSRTLTKVTLTLAAPWGQSAPRNYVAKARCSQILFIAHNSQPIISIRKKPHKSPFKIKQRLLNNGRDQKRSQRVPRCQGFNGPRKYEPDIWKRENILISVLSGAGASRSESPGYANRRRRPSGRGTLQHGPPPPFGVTLTRDGIHVH